MRLIFWCSAGVLLHTYAVYPVLLVVLGSVRQLASDLRFGLTRRTRRVKRRDADAPRVSIVFAAHNEESVIARKMANCASLEYPIERLEVLVGCDGCTDSTAARARAAATENVVVHEFGDRSGKPAILNRLMPLASGDVVVFCDANTEIEPDAIHTLVRHFRQPDIGCVCGELRLRSRDGGAMGEQLYWRYETLLKFLESRSNMLIGANGALFAIRRSLFAPIPTDGIVDDFLIALNVRAAGHRIVYEPEAVAWEEAAPSARHEFRRRVRIGAGNFFALRHTWRLLSPTAGRVALAFWSHKVCRWLVPLALAAMQISAFTLAREPFYGMTASLFGVLGLLALLGHRLDARAQYWAPASIPYYFASMNLALLLGLVAFLRGTQTIVWAPTARAAATIDAAEVP
ncbi:MAG TPA: glycosyltransferase family 2 protein [Vicinamibacterales bacterium]|jgi:cellulose synthase/poly-beta-1,6-N-acetylglucosamine synthase-like glycosyltransferase